MPKGIKGFQPGYTPHNKGVKGYKNSGSFNKGQVAYNKGLPATEEAKKINRLAHLGTKHTEETKIKMRKSAHRGKDCHLYKGGISPLLEQIRTCFKYRQWRSDIFTRDSFACKACGDKRGHNLEAHHIDRLVDIIRRNNIKTLEEALNCEELWNINNGVTLCTNCHKETDNYGAKIK
jgi:5-methylcytosine-specific restriction endonuclease McrA